jgi:hypothetical protein
MLAAVAWRWQAEQSQRQTGSSIGKSSRLEAFAERWYPLPLNSGECDKNRWNDSSACWMNSRVKTKYGKHTLFLGSSFYAYAAAQHAGERGMLPQRKKMLLKGETARKRPGPPMLMDDVS